MIDGIKDRVVSRKFGMGVSGLVFYALGATDTITVTTEEQLMAGAMAVTSIVGLAVVDAIKAFKG